MIKVNLDPNDVELAYTIAQKRFIGNLRMNKGFSYGYDKNLKNQLYDGFLGALGEVSWAKWTNSYHNASYTDNLQRYEDSDFQNNIEIRTQDKKTYNFLLIRPNEKYGKYILIIKNDDKDFNFTIMGSFIFNKDMPERLSHFGHYNRPAAYKIEVNELTPLEDNERQDKF